MVRVETLNEISSPLSADNERKIIVVAREEVTTAPKRDIYLHLCMSMSNKTITASGTKFNEDYQQGDVIRLTDDNNPFNGSSDTEDHIIATINAKANYNNSRSYFENENGTNCIGVAIMCLMTSFSKGGIFDTSANAPLRQHHLNMNNLQQANTTSFSASVYFNVLRSNAVPTAKTIKKSRYVNLDTATPEA